MGRRGVELLLGDSRVEQILIQGEPPRWVRRGDATHGELPFILRLGGERRPYEGAIEPGPSGLDDPRCTVEQIQATTRWFLDRLADYLDS